MIAGRPSVHSRRRAMATACRYQAGPQLSSRAARQRGAVGPQLKIVACASSVLAHYAPFDRNVLTACCSAARRRPPRVPFICTVRVARSHWNFRPANLPTVCTQLGISLKHHNAASDALACASIALRAMKDGFPIHSAEVGVNMSRRK
jgi:DNA polymerase III epsilon subunit-like protein